MGRYIVTSNTVFDPFTYEELSKPVLAAQEAHDATQEAYDALNMETEALSRYIKDKEYYGEGTDEDAQARKLYDDYHTALSELQEDLWNNGVSSRTRRGISKAKAGYAKNVTRLKAAIQARQERSKEYWNAVHQNPDLIAGLDPIQSGLDSYLADDNYGLNWYSYKGSDIQKDVEDRMAAKANEFVRARQTIYNVPGYNSRAYRFGIYEQEAAAAGKAVYDMLISGNQETYNSLDPISKSAADVAIESLNSSGVLDPKNMVSGEMKERAVQYAINGLVKGIGKTDQKDFAQPTVSSSSGSSKKQTETEEPQGPYGYSFLTNASEYRSAGFDDMAKMLNTSQKKKYESGSVQFVNPYTDALQSFDSPWELFDAVYNPPIRDEIRKQYGGLDIALSGYSWANTAQKEQTGIYETGDGKRVAIRTGKLGDDDEARNIKEKYGLPDDAVGIYLDKGNNTKGGLLVNETVQYNDAVKAYRANVQAWKDAEKEKNGAAARNIDDYAITPKQERKFRKQTDAFKTLSSADMEAYLTGKEFLGDIVSGTFLSVDDSMNVLRNNYSAALYNNLTQSIGAGNEAKSGLRSIYLVGEGGLSVSKKAIKDPIMDIYNEKPNTQLGAITVNPYILAKSDASTGEIPVQFTSMASPKKVFQTDASTFSVALKNSLTTPSILYDLDRSTGQYRSAISAADAVRIIMMPITDPQEVLRWDEETDEVMSRNVNEILRSANVGLDLTFGISAQPISLRTATGDTEYGQYFKTALINACTEILNRALAVPREVNVQEPIISTSKTSSTKKNHYTE